MTTKRMPAGGVPCTVEILTGGFFALPSSAKRTQVDAIAFGQFAVHGFVRDFGDRVELDPKVFTVTHRTSGLNVAMLRLSFTQACKCAKELDAITPPDYEPAVRNAAFDAFLVAAKPIIFSYQVKSK